ncbi:hypothetical protein AAVH_11487 [Aphelenchoides avenae]|nr:hypothetical protein AAVH_11487 [Aphelenchus avenae]
MRTPHGGSYEWSVVPEKFLSLRGGNASLRPLHFFDIHLLRDVWHEADVREVRPCSRCPQQQLERVDLNHWTYSNYFAVDTYHFWNEALKRRLIVQVEYYTRDMRCSEYFMETDYVVQSQHIHKLSISMDATCCIPPITEKCNATNHLQLDVLSGVLPFCSRRDLETSQLVCRQWRDVIDKWSNTLALHDIARVQEKIHENIMVHYAPSALGGCCECILGPKAYRHSPEQFHDEYLDEEAVRRLKALLRKSFVRHMLHYRTLGNMLELLEECAQERKPLRVDKYHIYPADWEYLTRCLGVAKKLTVQKYHFLNVMEHLSGDKILADEGIRGAKTVELEFTNGVPGDAATQESFVDFVYNSNEDLKLVLAFRYPYDALPFSADALIQHFLDADDLSRMAATVDLEYHSQRPFTRPRICTRAAQEKVDLTAMRLGSGSVRGPLIECIGVGRYAELNPDSLLFDIFHFYNGQCRQWLTCFVSSFAHGSGFIRLARGKIEAQLQSSQ